MILCTNNGLIKDSAWNTVGTKSICNSNSNCRGIDGSSGGCGNSNEKLVKGLVGRVKVVVNWH